MKIDSLEKLLKKKVKLNYNSSSNEICREEGILEEYSDNFIVLNINGLIKYISINKIIRIELINSQINKNLAERR